MGTAPIGYANKTDETGRKYITPEEPEASIIKWVFQELANGHFAADQIRKEVLEKFNIELIDKKDGTTDWRTRVD